MQLNELNAQASQFGVKGGLNFSSLIGDINDNVKSRISFHIGLVVELAISDMLSVQPEILYSSQGYKFNNVIGINDYINVPIVAKFYPVERLSIEIGPQLGILISSLEKDDNASVDVKEVYNTVDFGLDFGVGYKLDMGFNVGMRYNLGLAKTLDINNNTGIKNGVFQLYFEYFFN